MIQEDSDKTILTYQLLVTTVYHFKQVPSGANVISFVKSHLIYSHWWAVLDCELSQYTFWYNIQFVFPLVSGSSKNRWGSERCKDWRGWRSHDNCHQTGKRWGCVHNKLFLTLKLPIQSRLLLLKSWPNPSWKMTLKLHVLSAHSMWKRLNMTQKSTLPRLRLTWPTISG